MTFLRDRGNTLAWCAAAACAWLFAWWALSDEWSLNEQYQFGWGVPFLFAWIVWSRWDSSASSPCRNRPGALARIFQTIRKSARKPPVADIKRARPGGAPESPSSKCAICGLVAFGWILMAFGELLRWKDPIWRMTGALLALGAVFVTAACFYRLGGRALLKRQSFALAFSWFAVPLPVSVDQWVASHLLHTVTGFTTVVLSAAGIPALQRGNLIELRNGIVGVEEACSGISSFQASLLASVFLGEYFRLSVARRCALAILGVLACMASNSLRVLSLTLLVHRWSGAIAERWHDGIGASATGLSFLFLGLVAYKMAAANRESQSASQPFAWPLLRGSDGWIVLSSFIILPVGAWALFHPSGSAAGSQRPLWKLNCRDLPSGWSAAEVAPPRGAVAGLHFTRWESCQVLSPEGWSAQVTHLYWKPGKTIPATAFYHTPALCLSGVGWSSASEVETWPLSYHGRQTVVAVYHLWHPEKGSVVAIQSLSIGRDTDTFLRDLHHPSGTLQRFALLWRAPARHFDEEILAYMPDLGSPTLQGEAFSTLLNLTLTPNQ